MKKFFITLPIYYANGLPHIGHAYSSLLADTVARYKRILGYQVKLSVGTDEHSQKIVQKAQEQGLDVMTYLDQISPIRQKTRDQLNISYTDYIRTTNPKHKAFVTKVLQKAYEKGDFYEREYQGLYCAGCE